jgi:2-aminobenzoate-CoA ligase
VLWHTGGTTGRPKGCYHTHRRFLLGGLAVGEAMRPAPGERFAAAAPLGHALGFIYHTIFTLLHRATVVLIEDFRDPRRILDAVEAHGVNTFAAITATWARMLDSLAESPRELPSLTRAYAMWQTASSTDVRLGWKARGLELINNFGSTSYATWALLPRHDEEFPPGSLGKPLPGYEIIAATVADGTVTPVTAGPGQMAWKGLTGLTYWNRAELQSRDVVDGWSLSDDLIEFGAAGNAAYLGRTDYMISTAGYKVAPAEVELALGEHPAVREVSVVGAPCPMRGELVVAFVALEEGVEEGQELVKELQAHVKARLSPYKYPRRIHFVEAIPRDPVGKVRGRVLKEWASTGVPQSTGPTS